MIHRGMVIVNKAPGGRNLYSLGQMSKANVVQGMCFRQMSSQIHALD